MYVVSQIALDPLSLGLVAAIGSSVIVHSYPHHVWTQHDKIGDTDKALPGVLALAVG